MGEGDLILAQGPRARAQCTQWKMRPKAMNFLELKGQKQILYFSSSSCNAYNFVFHKMSSSKFKVTLDLHSQVKFRERRRPAQPTMSPRVKLAKQSLEDAYAGYTSEIKVSKPLVIALENTGCFENAISKLSFKIKILLKERKTVFVLQSELHWGVG